MKTKEPIKLTPARQNPGPLGAEKAFAAVTRKDPKAIRPFAIKVPEAKLTELRRRINATRWPDRENVSDASQGVQLRRFSHSPAIGRLSTTGARSKRSSMPYRISSRRLMDWTFI